MNTGNNENRAVITTLADSLLGSLCTVPALVLANLLFNLDHLVQEFDVAGREEIKAAVNIDNALARLRLRALAEAAEHSLFLLCVVLTGLN
jgi:hypothetical protein